MLLSQLLYIGCYIAIITILVNTVVGTERFDDYAIVAVCNLTSAWLLPISFTLTIGTVVVRTWRLYRIFTYFHPGRFIKDYHLMTFVFILLLVDIIVATVWMISDSIHINRIDYPIQEGVAVFQLTVRMCSQNLLLYGVVIGIASTKMTATLVLALLTCKIDRQSFAAKTLRVLVYIVCVINAGGFLVNYIFSLDPRSPLAYISLLTTLNLMIFFFIFLICLPPLLPVLKEKIQGFSAVRKKPIISSSS